TGFMASRLRRGSGRYAAYVREVGNAARSVLAGRPLGSAVVGAELDGRASRELIASVPLGERRRAGTFFTGVALRKQAVTRWATNGQGPVVDPACGAGDLLLAAAWHLPVERSLSATIRSWGKRLAGCDLHRDFIELTRARLVLLASFRS